MKAFLDIDPTQPQALRKGPYMRRSALSRDCRNRVWGLIRML